MRLGLLSDIHGNIHALRVVLADAAPLAMDQWWVLGDLVALGPDAAHIQQFQCARTSGALRANLKANRKGATAAGRLARIVHYFAGVVRDPAARQPRAKAASTYR